MTCWRPSTIIVLLTTCLMAGSLARAEAEAETSTGSSAVDTKAESKEWDAKALRLSPFGVEESSSSLRGTISANSSSVRLDQEQVSVYSFGGGLAILMNNRLALGGGLSQAFSQENSVSSLYTAFDGSVLFALTGGLQRSAVHTTYENERVLSTATYYQGGLRFGLSMNQYLFNTATSAVPFSGPGASLLYEMSTEGSYILGAGVRSERLSNGTASISTFSLFLQLAALR